MTRAGERSRAMEGADGFITAVGKGLGEQSLGRKIIKDSAPPQSPSCLLPFSGQGHEPDPVLHALQVL